MPIASELTIDTSADALALAQTIFGDGVVVGNATLTGATGASGIYSGGDATLGAIAPADTGIILSTGLAESFTNSSGTTDTNASDGVTGSNGTAGDALLDGVSGQTTFDAVVLEATFTPDGDYITMQFTFSSEEYLEYVNSGVNDAFGVWVNGVFAPFTPATNGLVSIDTINNVSSSNLYLDNPATTDVYNTEMDGLTRVLSIKAPVNSGQVNTIRISLADGGDSAYDSNVLIAADSVQTVALAFDDEVLIEPNTTKIVDVLANDVDATNGGLTITEINGVPVTVGQTTTLATGEQITLNADNTLTIVTDGDLGSEAFTYAVVDSVGNTDVGFVTITTVATVPLNYVVEGTAGADLIDAAYTLDPEGDLVDANDALDGSNNDSIRAGGGNDTVLAGLGDDTVDGGIGSDSILAGAGNDFVDGGDDNDTIFGEAGNDTLLGGNGADSLDGDDGDDSIDGGTGNDTLIGDAGNDTLLGGGGDDAIYVSTGNNVIDGGDGNDLVYGGDLADTIDGGAGSDYLAGGAGADLIDGNVGNDNIDGGAGNDTISGGAGFDNINGDDGNDSISGMADNDSIWGGAGNDTIDGGAGNDALYGGTGNDSILGGTGGDYIQLTSGNDTVVAGDDSDNIQIIAGSYADGAVVTVDGGTGGVDTDTLDLDGWDAYRNLAQTPDADADSTSGSVELLDASGNWITVNFAEIETLTLPATDLTPDYIVTGTSGDDLIDANYTGDPQGDMVDAGDALDGSEDDVIEAGDGNDTIDAGDGDDLIFGGGGNDRISGRDGNDTIYYGDGDDLQLDNTEAGNDLMFGEAGNDTLSGGLGDDEVHGGEGNDALEGGDGADSVYGGDGDDYLAGFDVSGLVAQGPTGNLTPPVGSDDGSADTLDGGSGNDVLLGGQGADSISGGDDADTIVLGDSFGNDTIAGGEGGIDNDTLYMADMTTDTTVDLTSNDPEAGTVSDGAGTATFTEIENIVLGAGIDTIVLADGSGADAVTGFAAPTDNLDGTYSGNDQLDVSGMTVDGTNPVNATHVVVTADVDGNAVLTFPGGESLTLVGVDPTAVDSIAELTAMGIPGPVDGTSGDDVIGTGYVDADGDQVDGTDGINDVIYGYGGNDSIGGRAGDDSILGGDGSDTIHGDEGNDTLEGGAGADSLFGWEGDDSLIGDAGNDTLNGGEGDDVLSGGDDEDLFQYQENGGADTIIGGEGGSDFDTLATDFITGNVNVMFTSDGGGVLGRSGVNSEFSEIEAIRTGSGNDIINANADTTGLTLNSGAGNDSVIGGSGNDSVIGGAGDDTLDGQEGDDTIEGGAGNDFIIAGAGDDLVSGGDGNDLIFGFEGADTISGGDGADVINGGIGADLLDGGADNDEFVIEDGFGADTIIGGETTTTGTDADIVRINQVSVVDPVDLTFTGNEEGTLSDGTDTLGFSEIEQFFLADNNDTVDGTVTTTGINVNAMGGDDSMVGGSGADTLIGGSGNDTIQGGIGADTITGGTGDDVIEAAQGDTVTGGDGDDTFNLTDLGEAGAGTITINGGEGGETNGDTLNLNGLADRNTLVITDPDDANGGLTGTVTLLDGTVVNFANIENIICFVPGTMIATPFGLRRIEDLCVGDPVLTQDNGIQNIGWIGKTTVSGTDRFAPVNFAKSMWPGAMDDLTVSPQHRMLIKGYRAELLFGQSEVLVPAIHLLDGKDVTRLEQDSVTYVHIMFEQHEIIFANGIPAESFHPGAFGVDALAAKAREELFTLFPELRSNLGAYGRTARLSLKAKEAKMLVGHL